MMQQQQQNWAQEFQMQRAQEQQQMAQEFQAQQVDQANWSQQFAQQQQQENWATQFAAQQAQQPGNDNPSLSPTSPFFSSRVV